MPLPGPSTQQSDPETRLLSDFIYELNVSRRHLATYPPGHPLIQSSTDQVLSRLNRLFKFRETVTLGVTRESLYFDRQWLDRKNPPFRDLAATLARLGIAALSFHRQPRRDELIRFNQLLCSDRRSIAARGGFPALLTADQQLGHIEITAVDYDSFQVIEEEHPEGTKTAKSLWENFITRLLGGQPSGDDGQITDNGPFEPAAVADLLARGYQQQRTDRAISSFVNQIQHPGQLQEQAWNRFSELVAQLTPELRRQFLASTFRNLDPTKKATEELLRKLPASTIRDSLEGLKQNRLQVSNTMVRLLGKLAEHRQQGQQSLIGGQAAATGEQLREQMNTIFREEEREKFTPDSYQQALSRIVTFEDTDSLPEDDAARLRQQLNSSSTERHSCAIMLRLLRPDLPPEQAEGLQNNLIDLAHFFLEVGDFRGLRFLHGGILSYRDKTPPLVPEQTERLLATLSDPQFQQEVLDNLKRWGEEKQQEIRGYIQATGSLFAASLVQRLANEEDMALRRLYVNTLSGMGKAAHRSIYASLSDRRWYLVRNLLSVLRAQNDPIELDAVYALENHPHPRVTQELLKLLFKFDCSRADNLLLKQLSGENQELRQHAIQLAELSHSPQVIDKLLVLLNRDRVTKNNLAPKLGIVKSLGLAGAVKALPHLEKLLFSGWLFLSAPRKQLKAEIIRYLDNYPHDRVQPLLHKLARSRQGELRRLAEEKLLQMNRSRG